ncbi:hypothetical protein V7x_00300 [Crateriforma conspicua]|uniref:Uncharacterized protein n=1 Tax=Crateriforma conspicua TaxID=2527996 RepID=A0A5C6FN04_9PLAN|nr:hypothetical protein V7x_00300 [Crateriforma conspicua]
MDSGQTGTKPLRKGASAVCYGRPGSIGMSDAGTDRSVA